MAPKRERRTKARRAPPPSTGGGPGSSRAPKMPRAASGRPASRSGATTIPTHEFNGSRPEAPGSAMIEAVVFDLDGVIVDSEHVWDAAREALARERGGHWHERAQQDMMGMSSLEWSRYMHDRIGLREPPEEISAEVVRRLESIYRKELPLIDGAPEAVARLAERWPLAIASSSNRPLIDLVLGLSGLGRYFRATVSSEEVPRGKPAPDVYVEAAHRLSTEPTRSAAVEDSHNGILSAKAAGMYVVAIPNTHYPPSEQALVRADVVLRSISELAPAIIEPPVVP